MGTVLICAWSAEFRPWQVLNRCTLVQVFGRYRAPPMSCLFIVSLAAKFSLCLRPVFTTSGTTSLSIFLLCCLFFAADPFCDQSKVFATTSLQYIQGGKQTSWSWHTWANTVLTSGHCLQGFSCSWAKLNAENQQCHSNWMLGTSNIIATGCWEPAMS